MWLACCLRCCLAPARAHCPALRISQPLNGLRPTALCTAGQAEGVGAAVQRVHPFPHLPLKHPMQCNVFPAPQDKLKELVQRYSEFISFPIYLLMEKEREVEVRGGVGGVDGRAVVACVGTYVWLGGEL